MISWEGDANFGGTKITLHPRGTYECFGMYETNKIARSYQRTVDYKGVYQSK